MLGVHKYIHWQGVLYMMLIIMFIVSKAEIILGGQMKLMLLTLYHMEVLYMSLMRFIVIILGGQINIRFIVVNFLFLRDGCQTTGEMIA